MGNLVRCLVALALLACLSTADQCDGRHPVVLIPGILGTVLHADLDLPTREGLPDQCPHHFTDQPIWIDVGQTINYKCFKNYFASSYDRDAGVWKRMEGINFTIPKWGKVFPVDELAPGAVTGKLIPYFHGIIKKLTALGYVDGVNMTGAGFDWKDVPSDEWVARVKDLVETVVANNGGCPAVLIAHSMGCPFSYYFMMKMGEEWVKKNVHMFIPTSPAWMGAVKALDVMIAGLDYNVPLAGKYFAPLLRHIPTVWLLLPWEDAYPNIPLATTPSKTYYFADLVQLLNDGNATDVEGKLKATRGLFEQWGRNYAKPPPVPVRAFVGHGKNTVISFKFKKDIVPHDPEGVWDTPTRIKGDGDGTVPYQSLVYATEKWAKMEGRDVKTFFYDKMGHVPLLRDSDIIDEIIAQFH